MQQAPVDSFHETAKRPYFGEALQAWQQQQRKARIHRFPKAKFQLPPSVAG